MKYRNTLSKCAIAAALVAAALEATPAGAAACASNRKSWGVLSDTAGNLQCQTLASRGTSKGGFTQLQGQGQAATALTVRLLKGIHATGIAYDALGNVMASCNPFDNSTADGAKTVGLPSLGCLGGVQHQVIVVF